MLQQLQLIATFPAIGGRKLLRDKRTEKGQQSDIQTDSDNDLSMVNCFEVLNVIQRYGNLALIWWQSL